MQTSKRCKKLALLAPLYLLLSSCTGTAGNIGVDDSKLSPCPARPNCVSSDSAAADHQVEPYRLAVPAPEGWQMVRTLVAELPRATIITQGPDYLHAECRSAVFGFVDDLELHLRPDNKIIAVRSAARLGYSDLGVNRKRVEELRSKLTGRGVITLPR